MKKTKIVFAPSDRKPNLKEMLAKMLDAGMNVIASRTSLMVTMQNTVSAFRICAT